MERKIVKEEREWENKRNDGISVKEEEQARIVCNKMEEKERKFECHGGGGTLEGGMKEELKEEEEGGSH